MEGTGLPTTTLGTTGLTVTRLGLGLAALGRPAYITVGRDVDLGSDRAVATMEQRCHEVLDAAYSTGIRYVDAARSYGRAEEFLASWLRARHIAPGALTIGSKWGYRYTGAWDMEAAVHETKDHSLAMLRRQLPLTTALLGSHLALYQVHSATFESGVLDDPVVLRALCELGGSGVAVGLTVSGPRQGDVVRHALDVEVDGVNPFSTVQATWNVLEPSVGPALEDAHARGWGVLVKEVLANGRLTDRGVGGAGGLVGGAGGAADATGSLVGGAGGLVGGGGGAADATAALREVVARRGIGVGIDQVAMAAALAQPWADVVLCGAVTTSQLESNVAALDVTLSDEERDLLTSVSEDSARYWDRRGSLPWT